MAAPATYPDWDTNGTNIIAVPAGRKTDGFGPSDVPGSGEVNGQLALIGQWVRYLGEAHPLTKTFHPQPFKSSNWAAGGDSTTPAGIYLLSSGAGTMEISLNNILHEDAILNDINVSLSGDGSVDITIEAYEQDVTGGTANLLGTYTATNPGASPTPHFAITGLAQVVSQLHQVWLRITASAANAKIYSVVLEPL